jgi:adhesin HecA-like repeat protein
MLLFDTNRGDGRTTELGDRFEAITDRVMGGVSEARLTVEELDGRRGLRIRGEVRLDNNGGFVQMATNLEVDASSFGCLQLLVRGNDETYGCHLRTTAIERPWQSYRQRFEAPSRWTTVALPLADFQPHRLDVPFDPAKIRRLGLIGIGREFTADLAIARVELVR